MASPSMPLPRASSSTNIGGGPTPRGRKPRPPWASSFPMHRVGFPDDLKGLALVLASPGSSYITGQQITIDGGMTLGVVDDGLTTTHGRY